MKRVAKQHRRPHAHAQAQARHSRNEAASLSLFLHQHSSKLSRSFQEDEERPVLSARKPAPPIPPPPSALSPQPQPRPQPQSQQVAKRVSQLKRNSLDAGIVPLSPSPKLRNAESTEPPQLHERSLRFEIERIAEQPEEAGRRQARQPPGTGALKTAAAIGVERLARETDALHIEDYLETLAPPKLGGVGVGVGVGEGKSPTEQPPLSHSHQTTFYKHRGAPSTYRQEMPMPQLPVIVAEERRVGRGLAGGGGRSETLPTWELRAGGTARES